MDHIMGRARRKNSQGKFPGDPGAGGEDGTGIQQRAHHNQHREKGKCRPHKGMLPGSVQMVLPAKEQACQQAAHAVSQHLPGRPGTLGIEKVTGKGGDSAGHEAGLGTKGHARDHHDSRDRLEIRYRDGYTAGNCQRRHHRDHHQLPCLGSARFEGQEKWRHCLQDHQRTGKVMPLAPQLGSQKQGRRDQHQQRNQRVKGRFFHKIMTCSFCKGLQHLRQ